ncbi:MmcQ/YjbR family DNA-binding protein [Kribbella qitaiheensis]|uniref:MmcQ/YjbR family DNA-binding protein n=1 Tax=Kribbella qitaiheensis TaxID=1544730 RepID=UPI00360B2578
MADQTDVRKIALELPEVREAEDRFAFSVERRGFAWGWLERPDPKKKRVVNPEVLVVRVADEGEKQSLLAADPAKFFTEPHYANYPAILVRLPAITTAELRELLTDAWRLQAPKSVITTFDEA